MIMVVMMMTRMILGVKVQIFAGGKREQDGKDPERPGDDRADDGGGKEHRQRGHLERGGGEGGLEDGGGGGEVVEEGGGGEGEPPRGVEHPPSVRQHEQGKHQAQGVKHCMNMQI